jgi:hypothetical protein
MTEAAAAGGHRGEDLRPGEAFFSSPAAPLGESSVSLDLAGIGVRLEGLDAPTAALLEGRFRGFLGERPGPVRVAVAPADVERFLQRERPGESYRLETRGEGEGLLAWSYGFAARYLPAERSAELRLAPEPDEARALSLENVVRLVVSWRALEEGDLLLHAAGIERDGTALAFFGPSGAGKTTLCRLSQGEGEMLSDDLLLLRRAEGGWEATALPLTGAYRARDGAGLVPLAGLYRLVQAEEAGVEELSTAVAVGEIIACVPFFEERPMDAALLEVAGRLAGEVPVRRLRFRRDAGFWEVLGSWS